MKKFSVIFLALMLALFFAACGKTTGGKSCDPNKECCNGEGVCPDDDIDDDDDVIEKPEPPCEGEECCDPATECCDGEGKCDCDPAVECCDGEGKCDDVCTSEICKIQHGEYAEGTAVTVKECVVTAILHNQDNETHENTAIQGVYVSDIIPEAQPYTGIYVFIKDTAELNEYKVGDKLEVKGTYKEYYDNSQIEATEINKLGPAEMIPAPAVVKPASVATPFEVSGQDEKGYDIYDPTANHGPDAEKYEGVLIQVENVEITNKYIGHGNFELDNSLVVTKTLYYYNGDRSNGVKFNSVTGILVYEYDAFRLAPRAEDDLEEAEPTDDDDDDDVIPDEDQNDVEPELTTIKEIQSGTKAKKDLVRIENVTVISPVLSKDFDNNGGTGYTFYVSDGNKGDYSGLYIYQVTGTTAPAKGDKVTIEGQVDFYGGQWQVKNAKNVGSITKENGTGTVPAALEKTYTALSDKDKGSLIEINELTVKSVEKPEGKTYTIVTFEEKVKNKDKNGEEIEKELIAENFGDVTISDYQAGDKLYVKGIYDSIFWSNGFYILEAGGLDKRIY